jgi:hypothetical protein
MNRLAFIVYLVSNCDFLEAKLFLSGRFRNNRCHQLPGPLFCHAALVGALRKIDRSCLQRRKAQHATEDVAWERQWHPLGDLAVLQLRYARGCSRPVHWRGQRVARRRERRPGGARRYVPDLKPAWASQLA